ncbi:MAG: IS1634 family transposase [Planctomycetota bacterium]|jgi:hypothetical protein|nr:IS1634 family transposase [Planctomycetota bacterium]
MEVNANGIRLENKRDFGGPWLALHLIQLLGLDKFLQSTFSDSSEKDQSLTALILVINRFLNPASESELLVAPPAFKNTALSDLLGVPAKLDDADHIYRSLDHLLAKKEDLEVFLKKQSGSLAKLEYDILFYNITSTYFKENSASCPLDSPDYYREHRLDYQPVVVALVVTRGGWPLGYEVFPGNQADVTSLQGMIGVIESRYGESDRIWIIDRDMRSDENLQFLSRENRRYIVGFPKSPLKKCEVDSQVEDWFSGQDGDAVKNIHSDKDGVVSFLCRSQDRGKNENTRRDKFSRQMEVGLAKLVTRCEKKKWAPDTISKSLGRLREKNSRASRFYFAKVYDDEGRARLEWHRIQEKVVDVQPLDSYYILHSNITKWDAKDLQEAYIHLTMVEDAFRIDEADLCLRPLWQQKEDRVRANILVCFLSFVLWKALGRLCSQAGFGDEPLRVLRELTEIDMLEVVIPTRTGVDLRKTCVSSPTKSQQILLERLHLEIPNEW